MSSWPEVLSHGAIRGEEVLRVPGGFKPLYPSLPVAGRLMRVLRAVIEVAVLAMFHARQNLPLGCTIAFEFIRDDHPWRTGQFFEQLAEEFLRGVLVPPMLHENIQDMAVLIHRPPQIVALLVERAQDLIQVPLVAGPGRRRRS
jgi:hypothetical protein